MSNGPASTRASSTIRRCPTGSSPAWRCAKGPMPVSSIASSTARCTIARWAALLTSWRTGLAPAIDASRPRATFSLTVRDENSSTRWNERPRPSRDRPADPRDVTSRPCNMTWPSVGFTKPEHALNVDVLPAPLGPTNPVMHAMGALRLTSCTAAMPPKRTDSPRTSSPTPPRSRAVVAAVSCASRRAASSSDAAACATARRTCSSVTVCSGWRPPMRSRIWRTFSGTVAVLLAKTAKRCRQHAEEDLEVGGDVVRREVARDDRHAQGGDERVPRLRADGDDDQRHVDERLERVVVAPDRVVELDRDQRAGEAGERGRDAEDQDLDDVGRRALGLERHRRVRQARRGGGPSCRAGSP